MSLSFVNLLWQKHRMRGLMAATGRNVADDGRALLIRPDELETRTYQVLSLSPNGDCAEQSALSVETVHRFDVLVDGRVLLGMTDDDIYLFRDAKKIRFMGDKRVLYTDACLAPEAACFVCGFSDALLASHAVALGDTNGRVLWTKDLETPPNRVAIGSDGKAVALALQEGRILALDSRRATLWESAQPEPVTALAMPASGARCAGGTEEGAVFMLDEDGGFRWRAPVGLPVLAVATDGAAEWVAAVCSDGGTHLLACLGPDGRLVWEYELDARPSGVSLSPNGRHLLVTTALGSAALFEVDFSAAPRRLAGTGSPMEHDAARTAEEAGDLHGARQVLVAALAAAPHDVAAARRLHELDLRLLEQYRAEAQRHAEQGDLHAALDVLETAAALAPWNRPMFEQRVQYRAAAVDAAVRRAREQEAAHNWDAATDTWLEVLQLDPRRLEAREALLQVRKAEALELMRAGDERHAAGDPLQAVALWQQAERLDPTEALESRLRQAEVERAVAAGLAYYQEQRLPEAAFQFKKALALEPEHETAHRYLGYCKTGANDHLISDRFARLE
jgi:hypothetical protein